MKEEGISRVDTYNYFGEEKVHVLTYNGNPDSRLIVASAFNSTDDPIPFNVAPQFVMLNLVQNTSTLFDSLLMPPYPCQVLNNLPDTGKRPLTISYPLHLHPVAIPSRH